MPTIAADLQRQRNAHQTRRIEHALVALNQRRGELESTGNVPIALDLAIAAFTHRIAGLRLLPPASSDSASYR